MSGADERAGAVHALYARYGQLIGDQDWEAWLDLFTEDATYRVTTRDNELRSLPVGIMLCTSRAMLADRIDAGRHANIYRKHVNRHLVGLPSVSRVDEAIAASCTFCVIQTEDAGVPFVFAAGQYRDHIVARGPVLRFSRKVVVLDNSRIMTSMPIPL